MNLCFTEYINGKPTFFKEKILCGFLKEEQTRHFKPKFHTIRRKRSDINSSAKEWSVGETIQFCTSLESGGELPFGLETRCILIQEISIVWKDKKIPDIVIDGLNLTIAEIQELAINDGFEALEDFLSYFASDFNGILIHWTTFKY
ncbi:hypothetical protein DBR11_18215 [Pedobacter sp. HMWF019]|uniref:hypothetical protein n=1 Tax=Pedobacter sp. HMWF019 TaxID=2056856 RepID=UPI000D34099B|nr:hypothetical protein [Pedobacter sp. HMWF019]PTS96969.1 hypothetical protein DBR11_18215 [Pedobacter sp. HMWF019]